jgi:hypothetical protein
MELLVAHDELLDTECGIFEVKHAGADFLLDEDL